METCEPIDVQVWWADLGHRRPDHARLLTGPEHKRRGRLRHPADQARFTLGTVVTKLAVAHRIGLAPGPVVIDRRCDHCGRSHGRPWPP